ncbi:MAG: MarR family transcriptional regulator [Chloroflexi bacterium]|nr:MarR family transcriptional regulator [Chloroflexota bacterium]
MSSRASPSIAHEQHRLIHDIYVLLDDGDRRVLQSLNLSPLEFSVLEHLDVAQGRRLTDIGAELLCVKSTITRLVDRLEAHGLVRRTPDPADRRAQRLLLTPGGLALRDAASQLHSAAVERRMSLLDQAEQQQLRNLLAKLRTGLSDALATAES